MMSGISDRHMDWSGSVKQGSLDNTASFRHYDISQNSVLWYIQNSKKGCGTCKLYPFQLNIPMQISCWVPLYIYNIFIYI